MKKLTLRVVFTGILFLLSTAVIATQATSTRDWTATRQPRLQGKPLPSGGKGEDFSLMNESRTPLSLGLVTPAQLPWGDWNVCGLRLSLIYGQCKNLTGVDLGLLNTVDEDLVGLQVGALNAVSRARGFQVGVINCAYYLKGVQVGLINYAEGAYGLQIGLINVITNTTPGMFPLIYGSF